MNKVLKKILNSIAILLLFFSLAFPTSAYHCDTVTVECLKTDIGWSEIQTDEILVQRNPIDYIVIALQLFLAIIVVFTIFQIVLAGLKIAGAREDADKRSEGFKAVVNALIGLAVALSALGLTQIVRNAFGGKLDYEVICADINADTPQRIIDLCGQYTGTL